MRVRKTSLRELIALSVRVLQGPDYSREQIEGSLEGTQGVDTRLIAEGSYYVAEARLDAGEPLLVGCGGWSKRKTLYGSDIRADRQDELLDPAVDAARLRAFFVHPEWTRRGIAKHILEVCEVAGCAAGFRRFEMTATLTGLRLYTARGYSEVERTLIPLPKGVSYPVMKQTKPSRIDKNYTICCQKAESRETSSASLRAFQRRKCGVRVCAA